MGRLILHAAGFAAIVGVLGFLLAYTLGNHQEMQERAGEAPRPSPSFLLSPQPAPPRRGILTPRDSLSTVRTAGAPTARGLACPYRRITSRRVKFLPSACSL